MARVVETPKGCVDVPIEVKGNTYIELPADMTGWGNSVFINDIVYAICGDLSEDQSGDNKDRVDIVTSVYEWLVIPWEPKHLYQPYRRNAVDFPICGGPSVTIRIPQIGLYLKGQLRWMEPKIVGLSDEKSGFHIDFHYDAWICNGKIIRGLFPRRIYHFPN